MLTLSATDPAGSYQSQGYCGKGGGGGGEGGAVAFYIAAALADAEWRFGGLCLLSTD